MDFDFNLEFRNAHGRKVSKDQWLRSLEGQIVAEARGTLEQKVRNVRCPTHGQSVTKLRLSATNPVQLEWEGCCTDLTTAIQQELGIHG